MRRLRLSIIAAALLLHVTTVVALELRVTELQASASRVALVLELRTLLRERFLETIQQGRAVFLQVQAELWEDRRITDRLALTTPELTYRVDREGDSGVTITDQSGNRVSYRDARAAFPIRLDMGPAAGLADDRSYYVRAAVTAATFAERDIDRLGVAVFGNDQSIAGLTNLGRYLFQTLLQIGRYLDSESAEVSSPRYTGLQIKAGAR